MPDLAYNLDSVTHGLPPVTALSAEPTALRTDPAREKLAWVQVTLAALLMVATLPGRTQGLGLITEPLLRDLHVDRIAYAQINLWATLLGSTACLPAGWLLDRGGPRWTTTGILLLLAVVVWGMSGQTGSITVLFLLVLLTRAFGQSALSVASITAVGRSAQQRTGLAMGAYSILLSIFFIAAFVGVGAVVSGPGWRTAWLGIAIFLAVVVTPLAALLLPTGRSASSSVEAAPTTGASLPEALRTPAFWIFGGSIALFGLVSSGLGLFNEAVLAERGFDQKTFHDFLGATTFFALLGQFACGWASQRWSMPRLLAVALFLYAAGLGTLPLLQNLAQLWTLAAVFGIAGGMITVLFFAVWSEAFGRAHLGRIQGAAQMLSVFASAIGPLCFAQSHASFGSYAPVLYALTPLVLLLGLAAWGLKVPSLIASPARSAS